MEKRERFFKTISGEAIDRPAVSAWVHFGSSHWSPEMAAEAHLSFLKEYDWDYLKVMNDYRFVTEGDIVEAKAPDDLMALGAAGLSYSNFEKQSEVLKRIRQSQPAFPVLDTVFSPFVT